MTITLILLALGAFTFALVLTPLVRNAAERLGWTDRPDCARKIHRAPVPRIGGVAVIAAYLLASGVAELAPGEAAGSAFSAVSTFLPALLVVFGTGLMDDIRPLRPWQKLLGQTAGAGLACAMGVQVKVLAGHTLAEWWCIPVTMIWLLACTNGFNLIDGVDGLASGIALFAALTMFAAAILNGNFVLAAAIAPLAGALLGFLRFNFNPASIFLGDSGSLAVGFLMGSFAVIWSQKSVTMLGMTAPLMAVSVPLLDTALSIVRRFLRRQPIFGADRAHIHHRLLDLGLTPRRAVLALYAASGIGAGFALVQNAVRDEFHGVVLVLFCAAAWIGVQHLGYQEFGVASRLLRLSFRERLGKELRLKEVETCLANATGLDERWRTLCGAAAEFGFSALSLTIGVKTYEAVLAPCANGHWTVRIPLGGGDSVSFVRDVSQSAQPAAVTEFADMLYRILGPCQPERAPSAAQALAPRRSVRVA